MPIFQYTAMDAAGEEQKGQHDAANEEAVATFLKEQGMFPTSIKPLEKVAKAKKAKGKGGLGSKQINLTLGPMVIKSKDLTVFTAGFFACLSSVRSERISGRPASSRMAS